MGLQQCRGLTVTANQSVFYSCPNQYGLFSPNSYTYQEIYVRLHVHLQVNCLREECWKHRLLVKVLGTAALLQFPQKHLSPDGSGMHGLKCDQHWRHIEPLHLTSVHLFDMKRLTSLHVYDSSYIRGSIMKHMSNWKLWTLHIYFY